MNLSATPCWERLKRLEDAGIIEGYGARVSLKAFGPLTVVFVEIQLESHQAEDFERFEKAIAAVPQVLECWAVGGGIDYFCKVMVKDIEAYQALIDRLLAAHIGINKYFSYVCTYRVKDTPLPIEIMVQPD